MSDKCIDAAMETVRLSVLWASAVARTVGIQPADLFAIAHLLGSESATAGELMGITGLTSGANTAMIDRLVAAGVVAREKDQEDGRRVIVRLIAPPPSVQSIREITSSEIRKVVSGSNGDAVATWLDVHMRSSAALRQAIAQLAYSNADERKTHG